MLAEPENTAVARQSGGLWRPGVSGNPGGRPKGVASYVREQTQDGREIVDYLLRYVRGETDCGHRERLEAVKILFDRGFGRAPEISLTATVDAGSVDLSALADDGLTDLIRTLARPSATHVLSAQVVDTVVDATFESSNPPTLQASTVDSGMSTDSTNRVAAGGSGQVMSGGVGDRGGQSLSKSPKTRAGTLTTKIPPKPLETSETKAESPKKIIQPKPQKKKKKGAPRPKAVKLKVKLKPQPAAPAVTIDSPTADGNK